MPAEFIYQVSILKFSSSTLQTFIMKENVEDEMTSIVHELIKLQFVFAAGKKKTLEERFPEDGR